jgi:hypothetical protein
VTYEVQKKILDSRMALRRHKVMPGDCAYCDRECGNDFHPPHDASERCQIGKRNHCSCDMCF